MTTHFNAGNVWGTVVDHKRGKTSGKNPKDFLTLQIDCSGPLGNVTAYGRIFGAEEVNALEAHINQHKKQALRFRGFFSMYFEKSRLYNFTFYKWEPAPSPDRKAAFVLRGEALEMGGGMDLAMIKLKVIREGRNGYKDTEEFIDLFVDDPDLYGLVLPGETGEFKGYLQQGAGEDEFGVATGQILPIVKQIKKLEG